MKLATIEKIIAIEPHGNADNLEIAKVLGWETIVKKGELKANDLCVFISIDTIIPRAPWSEFLADKKNPDKPIRLKTIKLRGRYSQGLVLPVSILPENVRNWQVGADVSAELGVKKYEKELPLALSGVAKGNFPTHLVAKTDEDNGLSHPDIVAYVESLGDLYVTQKLDGSSATVIVEKGVITEVCSRNLSLKETEGNAFWYAARKIKISSIYGGFSFQAEVMGPGIQGNQLKLKEAEFFVFSFFHKGEYENFDLSAYEFWPQMIEKELNVKTVPFIRYVKAGEKVDWQALADEQKLPDGSPAEGIVVRPVKPIKFGNGRPAGFKIINRNYKDT